MATVNVAGRERPTHDLVVRTARARGERWTQKRDAILASLLASEGHLRAEDILALVQPTEPHVSLSSVYRTLSLLVRLGYLSRSRFDGRFDVFEWSDDVGGHFHLVEIGSGRIHEFQDGQIAGRCQQIASSLGFDMRDVRLVINATPRQPEP